MANSLRFAVIETLCELDLTRLPVSTLLERIGRQSGLQRKDRQLAMKIVYGVLRNRDYLDLVLDRLCRNPTGRIKPFVRQALRSGLFQILFLDRIPPSAAVNETVEAVKMRKYPKQVQGFVNGLLRESIRRQQELPKPADLEQSGKPILNHPFWLTDRWQKNYGTEAMLSICRYNNQEPLLCLRTNAAEARQSLVTELQNRGIQAHEGAYAPGSLIVPEYRGLIAELEGIKQGSIQVQDQASQLVSLLLAPFWPGLSCLDSCAGLGGKTTHLASLLSNSSGSLTAVEPDPGRFRLLLQNLERSGTDKHINAVNQTLQDFVRVRSDRFNRILIDAPCSGTGVIGRHPDIRWNRSETDLTRYAEKQLELLVLSAPLLDSGGVLVYATCSIEPEENEQVIERFLHGNDDYSRTDCQDFLPPSCKKFIRNGCFAPLPENDIDGFFCARLTRR